MTAQDPFVIVGGGLAGAKAAETLRAEGFDGPVVLVGEEAELPYERPPLSKGYLLGTADRESAAGARRRTGTPSTTSTCGPASGPPRLDPAAHRLTLDTGEELAYAKLLLATGSSARRLPVPGADLDGVRYLRTLADADRLRADLAGGGRRVVVVGAGWIGLEVAAAARHHGNEVTVVEPQPTPLHAVLGPEMGAVFAAAAPRRTASTCSPTRVVREFRGAGGRVGVGGHRRGTPGCPPTWSSSASAPSPNVGAGRGRRPRGRQRRRHRRTRCARRRPTCSPPATSRRPSTRSTAGTSASSTGPTRSTAGRPRPGRCSGRRSATTGCPTSSPTSTTWAWSTRGSAAPATRWSAAATRTTASSSRSGCRTAGSTAGMNVNVWDVTEPIQELIRSRPQVPVARLADPDVPLERPRLA